MKFAYLLAFRRILHAFRDDAPLHSAGECQQHDNQNQPARRTAVGHRGCRRALVESNRKERDPSSVAHSLLSLLPNVTQATSMFDIPSVTSPASWPSRPECQMKER